MDLSKHVMGRMDWLAAFKRIFNRLTQDDSFSREIPVISVRKELLVEELLNRSSKLPLLQPAEYYAKNRVLALSLEEVVSGVWSLKNQEATWDKLLDMVAQGGDESTKDSFIDSKSLEISFPIEKLSRVPALSSRLEFLSLAGNHIEHTRWDFPSTLIVLNLAGNDIKRVEIKRQLTRLRLLNLSNNRINEVTEIPMIKELYIGYNSIKSLDHLSRSIQLLDLSYNEIASLEGLSKLTMLRALKLKGNPVSYLESYKQLANSEVSCTLDPTNLTELSEFRTEYLPFVPLKRPPNYSKVFNSPSKINLHHAKSQVITTAVKRVSTNQKTPTNKIVVTKERIMESRAKTYDNPIKALMIPAAKQASQVKRKTERNAKRRTNSDQKIITISLFKH